MTINQDERPPPFTPEELAQRIADQLAGTSVEAARAFHLRLVWAIENALLQPDIVKAPHGVPFVVQSALAKVANELGSGIGCLYAGSPWGALHHGRSLLETTAGLCHLAPSDTVSEADTEKRRRRFCEFPDAAEAAAHETAARKKGIEPYSKPLGTFTADKIALAESKRMEWKKLYELRKWSENGLTTLKWWHQPRNLSQLMEALPDYLTPLYDYVCHATHWSPIGDRLGQRRGHGTPLVVSDGAPPKHAVALLLQFTTTALGYIHKIAPNARLWELTRECEALADRALDDARDHATAEEQLPKSK